MVAALTGGIYLFGAEIVDLANRELLFVESTVFVDPYTASVQGTLTGPKKLESFFRVVRQIHQRLYAGTTGRVLVELATTWTIILILSGVYLWWPRRQEKVKGVWLPRWRAKPYAVLRDLHALSGVYLLPICSVIIPSGLFYTLVWGESFHFISKRFFAEPAVADGAEQPASNSREEPAEEEPHAPPLFSLQQAVVKARSLHPDRDVTVTLPSRSADHYRGRNISLIDCP